MIMSCNNHHPPSREECSQEKFILVNEWILFWMIWILVFIPYHVSRLNYYILNKKKNLLALFFCYVIVIKSGIRVKQNNNLPTAIIAIAKLWYDMVVMMKHFAIDIVKFDEL